MIINVIQKPEGLTPTNTEHVWTVSSNNSGYTNFKYILDIYLFPYHWTGVNRKKVARLKAKPNSEGLLCIDIQTVIQSLFDANIRVDNVDYYLDTDSKMWLGNGGYDSIFTTKPTLYDAFSKANGGSDVRTSGATPYEADPGLKALYHFGEYRVMIGEEYLDETLTPVINVSENPELLPDFGVSYPYSISSYPEVNGGVQYVSYLGGYEQTNPGVLIEWYDSTLTTLKGGTSSITDSGNWETPTQPVNGDRLKVISNYSGKTTWFTYQTGGEEQGLGWVFNEVTEGEVNEFTDGYFQPQSIFTWVGADNELQRKDLIYSNVNNGTKSHLYNWEQWVMLNVSQQTPKHYGKFLNVGGKESTFDAPFEGGVEVNLRERTLYVGEPLMVSFFNGHLHEFYNEIRAVVLRKHFANQSPGSFISNTLYNIRDYGGAPLVNVTDTYPYAFSYDNDPVGSRLLHYTANNFWLEWDENNPMEYIEVNTWGWNDDPASSDTWLYEERASEVFRYNIKDVNCFDTPVYFVFLNSNGAWDTFTFGARSTKTYDMARSSYEQGANYNSSSYQRHSWDKKTNIYNQQTTVRVSADTEYLQEYDSRIVEDLIRSTQVYIVQNSYPSTEEQNVTLIPVKLLTNSVQEYNKNYQKLYQHSVEFEYDNVTGYRNSL